MATVADLKGGRRIPDGVMAQWQGDEEPEFKKTLRATIRLSKARLWTPTLIGLTAGAFITSLLTLISIFLALAFAFTTMLAMAGHSLRVWWLKRTAVKLMEEAERSVTVIEQPPEDGEKAA